MGANTVVFKEYHQKKKNLTDWYIEPDGSLVPKDGDGAAEVVTPPLPAKTAMDALTKFYQLADQLNLYTSKQNNTGLHINVSIPEKLDVLKLAVFLGDQYVLQQFGREDNEYAQSVMQDLIRRTQPQKADDLTKVKTIKKKDIFGKPITQTKINYKMLGKLANDITDDHVASISNNGKYISFRHSGGNYLGEYQKVYNTVGRFIRAMIIASDPNAYANEYQTKLYKLLQPALQPQKRGSSERIKAMILALKRNQLSTVRIDVIKTRSATTISALAKEYADAYLGYDLELKFKKPLSLVQGSQEAKSTLLSKVQSQQLKKKFEEADLQNFFTYVYDPSTDTRFIDIISSKQLQPGVNGVFTGDWNNTRLGYVVASKVPIDPSSDAGKKLLLTLYQAYKKEMLGK